VQRFEGRRVLVTGGGAGIGQAVTLRLLSEGAHVVAVDIAEDALEATAELAGEDVDERLCPLIGDVAEESSVADFMATALNHLGGLDVLVNNAAVLHAAHTHETSLELWNRTIAVNLTGMFLVTRAALPALTATKNGVVVTIGSTAGSFTHPFLSACAATKGGVQAFSRAIAAEYADQGLRAVTIQPAGIDTGMPARVGETLPEGADIMLLARNVSLLTKGALVPPDRVAGVVAMVASDDGRYITGTEIRVDGGAHA
jgi:NAD(P)-dependent dehydrogenase (short-subunit alcohol dehydrogenase family)